MASNFSNQAWSVKITSLPKSITVNELAGALHISASRIRIPKKQLFTTYYAIVNDFETEKAAKAFADEWLGLSVFGNIILCTVFERTRNDLWLHNTPSGIPKSNVQGHLDMTPNNHSSSGTPKSLMSIKIVEPPDASLLSKIYSNSSLVFDDVEASGTSLAKTSKPKQYADNRRLLCQHADEGMCRNRSNEYKYRHQRCEHFESCFNTNCCLVHAKNATPRDSPTYSPTFQRDSPNHDQHISPSSHFSNDPFFSSNSSSPINSIQSTNGKEKSYCHDWNYPTIDSHERPIEPDQLDVCLNLKCIILHDPNLSPCEIEDVSEDESCTQIHSVQRDINLQQEKLASATTDNKKNKPQDTKEPSKSPQQRTTDWEKLQLSILYHRAKICQRLQEEDVLVVSETDDTGTSTQLSQYIAEHFRSLVVYTQPNSAVALSLARRAVQEYDERSFGQSVGYKIDNNNQTVGKRIMFMTDVGLVCESQRHPNMEGIGVLIIGEADKRALNTDDVFRLAKRLLAQRPKDFYVVILSATDYPTRFLQLFGKTMHASVKTKGSVVSVNDKSKPLTSDNSKQNSKERSTNSETETKQDIRLNSTNASSLVKQRAHISLIAPLRSRVEQSVSPKNNNRPVYVDQVIEGLEFNIVLIGSPCVGKSQLINTLCGEELTQTSPSLNACTQGIQKYVLKTDKKQTPDLPSYIVNFYDTLGVESGVDHARKRKILELIEETDPICVIYCTSPDTFTDLIQLRPMLNKCKEKRIVCALICTNMWLGNRRETVMTEFERELRIFGPSENKYSAQPRQASPHQITVFGNAALCTMVNSADYYDLKWSTTPKPVQGIDELIHGIMEILDEEKIQGWCAAVLKRRSFWEKIHDKANDFFCSRLSNLKMGNPETIIKIGMLFEKAAFQYV